VTDPRSNFLGVDVGGTKVAVGAVAGGAVEKRVERPTDLSSSSALLDQMESAVREVSERTGPATAVGVGVPSQVDFDSGRVLSSINVPLDGIALKDELARRIGAPVFVDNDANCAALAEAHVIGSVPAGILVMYTLGSGVGGGVVIEGRIFRGATGLGAELGHVVVDPNGPNCPGRCPNRGCLEAYASGTALERDATELAEDRPDSTLGQIAAENGGRVTGHDVEHAALGGDPDALALFDRLGTWLGVGISNAANVFEPQHIVIGGGLSRASQFFLDTARAEAASRALPAIWERVSVSVASAGADAGVIGAGTLALQEHARSEDTAAGSAARLTTIDKGA
jgi:glucokinase